MDSFPPFPAHAFDPMAAFLRGIDASLGVQPTAILVISAHWEEDVPTVQTAAEPSLIYDYYGFPEHTYALRYPCKGSPQLAQRVLELLAAAGIESGEDAGRGFDHGMFIPLMLMFPQADIPVVQLSLQHTLDPSSHIALGRALEPLRNEGVLIVGSGMSYHNLRHFFDGVAPASQAFDDWLRDAVADPDVAARNAKLENWEQAPFARACHPREEHLLPLMVVAGAAGRDTGRCIFNDALLGKEISGFRFG
jgi:aromatic ring-opening dioxygenase catalytic subunit (LigB family)